VAATADAANGSAGSAGHVLRPRWPGRSNRGSKRGRRVLDACGADVARTGPGSDAMGPGAISMQGFAGHYHKKKILSLVFTALFLRSTTRTTSSFIYYYNYLVARPSLSVSAYLPEWQKQQEGHV